MGTIGEESWKNFTTKDALEMLADTAGSAAENADDADMAKAWQYAQFAFTALMETLPSEILTRKKDLLSLARESGLSPK